jgi:hypothetical protein
MFRGAGVGTPSALSSGVDIHHHPTGETTMTHRITTVRDLENWLDQACGPEYLTSDPAEHPAAVQAIARQLWEDGHDEGYRSGQDWTEFLDEVSVGSYLENYVVE